MCSLSVNPSRLFGFLSCVSPQTVWLTVQIHILGILGQQQITAHDLLGCMSRCNDNYMKTIVSGNGTTTMFHLIRAKLACFS